MPARALNAEQVAAEFGRSKHWLYENWKALVAAKKLPPPIEEAGHLVWDAAQVYAFRDKDLPPRLAALAAAHRACMEAAPAAIAGHADDSAIATQRASLDRRFARGAAR